MKRRLLALMLVGAALGIYSGCSKDEGGDTTKTTTTSPVDGQTNDGQGTVNSHIHADAHSDGCQDPQQKPQGPGRPVMDCKQSDQLKYQTIYQTSDYQVQQSFIDPVDPLYPSHPYLPRTCPVLRRQGFPVLPYLFPVRAVLPFRSFFRKRFYPAAAVL